LLSGKRIVATRPAGQAQEPVDLLQKHGAEVENLPCIRIESLGEVDALFRETIDLHRFDWTFFTSANAVSEFDALLRRADTKIPPGLHVAAIGKKTAHAAKEAGFEIDFEAKPGTVDDFINRFFAAGLMPEHVLYPTSRLADNRLEAKLASRGVEVTRLDVYQTVSAVTESDLHRLFRKHPEVMVFYSPSAVRYFFEALPKTLHRHLPEVRFAAIGVTTAQALRAYGVQSPIVPEQPVTAALVDALIRHFGTARRSRHQTGG
jgi:uroporphyrinogen-III synthase